MKRGLLCVSLLLAVATTWADDLEGLASREAYNLGLTKFAADDLEAAEEAFLAARDTAGADADVLYQAAFNLGYLLSARADTLAEEAPERAIEILRSSMSWFGEAVRAAPEDDSDARRNLEFVQRRVLELADQINGQQSLEDRLERAIDDQRTIRDSIRELLEEIAAAEATTHASGFESAYGGIATRERMLLADMADVLLLAAEERGHIEGLGEEEATDEQRVRAQQLQLMEYYLTQARQSASDARRHLRQLNGERSHRRADAALAELKRAYEQLLDPVRVLRAIEREERQLSHDTELLARAQGIALEGDEVEVPVWLNAEELVTRQERAIVRTSNIVDRFDYALEEYGEEGGEDGEEEGEEGEDPNDDEVETLTQSEDEEDLTEQEDESADETADGPTPEDKQKEREMSDTLARVEDALPWLRESLEAMQRANDALESEGFDTAYREEIEALEALSEAIEAFANVRGVIELAYRNHLELITDLEARVGEPLDDAIASLQRNMQRLDRLEYLLDEEEARAAEDKAAQEAAQASAGDTPPADENAAAQQEDAEADDAEPTQEERDAERREMAKMLTDLIRKALTDTETDLVAARAEAALSPAQRAQGSLEELRRLYFSIIEHLRDLATQQEETWDATGTVQFEATEKGEVGDVTSLAREQTTHRAYADALADALDKQAQAAAASPMPQVGPDGENPFAQAAGEVGLAALEMTSAADVLDRGSDKLSVEDLKPVLEHQQKAVDHIISAIMYLQPPNENNTQQSQGEENQAQGAQGEDDEQMSNRQAQQRLQSIRDREAERRRRNTGAAQREPVAKDW